MAVLAHPGCELPRGLQDGRRVVAVGALDRELGPAVERLLDPGLGRRHADADPVVLADEQQRQRLALVGEVGGRVERGLRGRVIERRVAERAHDDRVERPLRIDVELTRPFDRERDAHGPRWMRGDRRRLRDDREVVMAEDLVPTARDRLFHGRCHPEQDVPHAVATGLVRAREVEAARSIVEKRRVACTHSECDEGVRLVPRRADRVEAQLLALEPARGVVDRTTLDLRAPRNSRLGRELGFGGRGRKSAQTLEEMLFEGIEVVAHRPLTVAGEPRW